MADEVGVRLSVSNRTGFSREMGRASDDVDRLGRAGHTTDRRLGVMGRTGQRTGRLLKTGLGFAARGAALGIGVAVGGLGFAVKQGYEEFNTLNQVTQQTKARMKSTGGVANVTAKDVRKMSKRLEEMSSVDENLIGQGQNLLLTFRNVRNEAGLGNKIFDKATKSALNLSTAGFGDMTSTSKMLGKALNDPIKGMSAMSRAGVTFSESQQKAITKMQESGNLLGAQKIILKEVEKQVGGSAKKYGSSFEGGLNRAKDAWGDFTRTLFKKGAPVFTKVLGWATDFIGGLQGSIGGFKGWFNTSFMPFWNRAWELVSGAIRTVWPTVRSIFNNIVSFVQTVIGKLQGFWRKWGSYITGFLRNTFSNVARIFKGAFNIIRGIWNALAAILRGDWKALWQAIKNILGGAWDVIRGLVGQLWEIIKKLFRLGAELVNIVWRKLWDGMKTAVTNVVGGIGNAAKNVVNSVILAINWIIDKINSIQVHIHLDPPGPGPRIDFDWNGVGLPSIPFLSEGGRTTRAGMAIVGEDGPEGVRLPRGAEVVPLKSSAVHNNGDITIHINESRTPRQTADAIMKLLGDRLSTA